MTAFILGAVMGSFMLCVTEEKESLFRRSCCEACGHVLRWFELIPVISYSLLRGRCRNCRQILDIRYLIVEVSCGLLFSTLSHMSPVALALIIFLVPLAIFDIRHFKVPNHVLLLFAVTMLLLNGRLLMDFQHIIYGTIVVMLLHLFYFLTASIGYGDVKLLMILVLFIPWSYFLMIFMLTYISGGIAAIIFLFYKHNLRKLPLVPFITVSCVIVLHYFPVLYSIYFGGFL